MLFKKNVLATVLRSICFQKLQQS